MDQFQSSDLKAILHSKRANLYYLEHCRVMQKDGRVLYLTEAKKEPKCFGSLPHRQLRKSNASSSVIMILADRITMRTLRTVIFISADNETTRKLSCPTI